MSRLVRTLRREDPDRAPETAVDGPVDPSDPDADPLFLRIHERLESLVQAIGNDADSLSTQAARIESLLTREARPARLGALLERIAALERGVAEIGDVLVSEFSATKTLGADVASLRTLVGESLGSEPLRALQEQLEALRKSGSATAEATCGATERLDTRFAQFATLFEERMDLLQKKLAAFDGALTEIRWALANRPGVDRLERKVNDLCRKVDVMIEQGVGGVLERSLDEFLAKIDRSRDEMARIARDASDPAAGKAEERRDERQWPDIDGALRPRREDGFFHEDFPAPALTAQRPPSGEPAKVRPGRTRRRALTLVSAAVLLAVAAWLAADLLPWDDEALRMLEAIRTTLDQQDSDPAMATLPTGGR